MVLFRQKLGSSIFQNKFDLFHQRWCPLKLQSCLFQDPTICSLQPIIRNSFALGSSIFFPYAISSKHFQGLIIRVFQSMWSWSIYLINSAPYCLPHTYFGRLESINMDLTLSSVVRFKPLWDTTLLWSIFNAEFMLNTIFVSSIFSKYRLRIQQY